MFLNMTDLLSRITINPKQCGGRPWIRGMRIRVIDVLDLFAAGLTAEQILEEMPDLEREDLQAALQYAARYNSEDANKGNDNLSKENFVGMWKDRKDLSEDSATWVRAIRRDEWAK